MTKIADRADAEQHFRVAVLAHSAGQTAEAEAAYRRALLDDQQHPGARANLAVLLLGQGRYAEAWPLYEARFAAGLKGLAANRAANIADGMWAGESLAGKSLLIWPEQGYGDYIQFARYAPLLKRMGLSKLTLVCAPALVEVLASVDGVDAILTASDAVPRHDYWLPLMSLPFRFGTTLETIPAAVPYIRPDATKARRWAEPIPALKVGLVWRGSPDNARDAARSLASITALAPILQVPGVRFYSLQRGDAETDIGKAPGLPPVIPLGAQLGDFSDAAAAISCLDLLICVDTAYAHLAGAMGVKCWVLVQAHGADWRWMNDRTDSPWYPGVIRLFRQRDAASWDSVVADIARELGVASATWLHRQGSER